MESTKPEGPKIYRWACADGSGSVDGEFVRLEDYAKLAAENKRLRRACAMALLELERTESTAAGDIADTVFDDWKIIRELGNEKRG